MIDSFDAHLTEVLSDVASRRRYAQNSLVVDVAVALNEALEASGLSQKDLADRLGRTEGYVSQVLGGGGNLTLKTLGDIAFGLECDIEITLTQKGAVGHKPVPTWKDDVQLSSSEHTNQYALAA